MINIKTSTLTLPPADPRDAAVKELDSMCREVIESVHKLEEMNRAGNERMIGRLEERIYRITDEIHARQRKLYLDDGILIAISHTIDGLPIRVNKPRKTNLWG